MATLERVIQMKQKGLTEPQIINLLKQEGVSPKEINDALSQSQIKSEIAQQQITNPEMANMKPSIMLQENQTPPSSKEPVSEEYSEQPSESYESYPASTPQEGYYQEPSYYPEYQSPQTPTDLGTISDIAEQIVEEKNIEIKKQISSFKSFREEAKFELEKINERLQKLENNFNELQLAVLRKIGDYGEDIKNIATEMHETQDSFSKLLNPLTDNLRELQKITSPKSAKSKEETQEEPEAQEQENQRRKPTKPEPGFEDYLR